MKRFMIYTAGLIILLGAWAFAAERAVVPAPAKTASAGTATAKITKMRAPGTILEITDSTLIIERKVKNNVEKMVFVLEKPMKFKVGDKVRVSYMEADGRMIVTRIVKIADLNAKKPAKPGRDTKAAASTLPATK
ncbi:MAG: hypothetical protein V1766_01255 [Pseudomonadota bacterium]